MNLVTTETTSTMSSLELRDIINAARADHGESKVENSHFLKRIEDELEGELVGTKTFRPAQGGTPMKYYDLTRDQCTLVGMRESKGVRRAVLQKLKEVDQLAQSPAVKDPQLAAMVTMLTQLDSVKQEQESQRTELADIRAKLTSSPEQYYTVAGYASLRGINMDVKQAAVIGRRASKLSRDQDINTGETHSEAFGKVKTYHVDILCQVFADMEGK